MKLHSMTVWSVRWRSIVNICICSTRKKLWWNSRARYAAKIMERLIRRSKSGYEFGVCVCVDCGGDFIRDSLWTHFRQLQFCVRANIATNEMKRYQLVIQLHWRGAVESMTDRNVENMQNVSSQMGTQPRMQCVEQTKNQAIRYATRNVR